MLEVTEPIVDEAMLERKGKQAVIARRRSRQTVGYRAIRNQSMAQWNRQKIVAESRVDIPFV